LPLQTLQRPAIPLARAGVQFLQDDGASSPW
jgi:hypothetical protein